MEKQHWRKLNPERAKEAERKWREMNKDKIKVAQDRWRLANPGLAAQRMREWRLKNQERHSENCRRRHRELKDQVYAAYGGYKCSCPKCEYRFGCDEKFLSIDHIENDGAE